MVEAKSFHGVEPAAGHPLNLGLVVSWTHAESPGTPAGYGRHPGFVADWEWYGGRAGVLAELLARPPALTCPRCDGPLADVERAPSRYGTLPAAPLSSLTDPGVRHRLRPCGCLVDRWWYRRFLEEIDGRLAGRAARSYFGPSPHQRAEAAAALRAQVLALCTLQAGWEGHYKLAGDMWLVALADAYNGLTGHGIEITPWPVRPLTDQVLWWALHLGLAVPAPWQPGHHPTVSPPPTPLPLAPVWDAARHCDSVDALASALMASCAVPARVINPPPPMPNVPRTARKRLTIRRIEEA